MTPGIRKYKQASCKVVVPMSVPEHLHDQIRELVSVQSEQRGKGHAAGLLESVCAEADGHAMVLMLMVRAFADGLREDELIEFYAKRGFFVAGMEPVIMVRAPVIGGVRH